MLFVATVGVVAVTVAAVATAAAVACCRRLSL